MGQGIPYEQELEDASAIESAYRKVSRRLVPPLLLAYIIAYLDRVNIGFAKLQMLQELHFTNRVYGFGAGIFFFGYFLFGLPSNMILQRIGARVWIATLMITWSVISAATVLVSTPAGFYGLRFLLGVAEAGFFPGVIFYFTQWYSDARRNQVMSVFMMGIAVCGAFGSVLSGWIMQAFDGHNGWAGWRWLFVLEAAPGLVVGLYILRCLDENIAGSSWLSSRERALLARDLVRPATSKKIGSVADALREGRVWLACIIYFCAMTGLYGVSFWLPTIISELGFHRPFSIGLLAAIPYAFAGLGMILMGRSADHRGKLRWHVAIAALVGALGLALSALFSHQVPLAMVALTFATFGVLTVPPLFWSLPTRYLHGAAAAVGIAVINSFGCLAGFASPYLVGWIKDASGSTNAGMYMVAAVTGVGAILVMIGFPSSSE